MRQPLPAGHVDDPTPPAALLQGRLQMAIIMFVLAGALWFLLLGWIIHLWSAVDAVRWKPTVPASALKIALLAPMPTASDRITVVENSLRVAIVWNPWRISRAHPSSRGIPRRPASVPAQRRVPELAARGVLIACCDRLHREVRPDLLPDLGLDCGPAEKNSASFPHSPVTSPPRSPWCRSAC